MRLLRYGKINEEKPGLLDSDGNIRDLSSIIDDVSGDNLSPKNLQILSSLNTNELPLVDGDVRYGPCVANVKKFIGIGLNYVDHVKETGAKMPKEPVIFMKATSAINGPNDNIIRPKNSTKLDWEIELGIVIGKKAQYVSEEEALQYIAGYCIVNDVSEREFQLECGGLWDKGKGCDTFGPIGPWVVTTDELTDVNNLSMSLAVNGTKYQEGHTSTMIFPPTVLISYVSRFMTLEPGDIIASGTPPGVGLGQKPPKYLADGDVMDLRIEGLGKQRQSVVASI